jgi:hypothetical protein
MGSIMMSTTTRRRGADYTDTTVAGWIQSVILIDSRPFTGGLSPNAHIPPHAAPPSRVRPGRA